MFRSREPVASGKPSLLLSGNPKVIRLLSELIGPILGQATGQTNSMESCLMVREIKGAVQEESQMAIAR